MLSLTQDIERAVNLAALTIYMNTEYNQRQQFIDEMREANRKLWYPAKLIGLNGGKWYEKEYEVLR